VIKAGATRLLPPEKRVAVIDGEAGEPHEAEEVFEPAPAEHSHAADAYQAEYDELLETAQEEVAKLLTDARGEAREIIDQAEAEAEKAREIAYAEGFENGHDDGFNAAVDEAEKAFQQLFAEGQKEVDKVVADAYTERDKLLTEMEPKILRLALDISEKIVGYELEQDSEAFVALVTAALNTMKQEARVTLRIGHEQHTGAFRSKAAARFKTDRGSVEADLTADPGLGPDGCLIETGNGTVDASVSSQLEQISRNLGLE
jgi:flagellar assembly protein FliH